MPNKMHKTGFLVYQHLDGLAADACPSEGGEGKRWGLGASHVVIPTMKRGDFRRTCLHGLELELHVSL